MTPGLSDPARSIELDRTFEAPVGLVFRLWTDPRLVAMWWGVENATNPTCEMDVRPGGRWRIDMRTATGRLYRNEGVYLDVVQNERLVYSDVADAELGDWEGRPPGPRIHTVTFEDAGQGTRVRLKVQFETEVDRDRLSAFGMARGLGQGLDRLAALIGSLANTSPSSPADARARSLVP